jgi:hypothetical protein
MKKRLLEDYIIIIMRVIILCIHTPDRRSVNIMLKRDSNANQNYKAKIPFVIQNIAG